LLLGTWVRPGIPEIETRTELVYGKPVTFKLRLGKIIKVGNANIELVQPVEGKSLHQEFLDTQGEGMHHVSFAVDFKKERDKLVQKGVPVVLSRENDNSFSYFDMRKFGDMLVELNQRT
jgi:methylmalonyl-CoA/ethylmalonyl-CoA epimerase